MRNKVPLCVPRIARIGALLTVAVLAAVMTAGPAGAHHRDGHDGGRTTDPGGGETATFKITVSGDLGGNVTVTRAINGKESSIQNVPEDGGEDLELDMTDFFANVSLPGWGNCFAGGTFSGTLAVYADKNDPGTGWAGFWFTAEDNDATTETEINYQLAVTLVTIVPPPEAIWPYWLPAANETTTVTGGPWEMLKGNGPGRKVACTGEGTGETLNVRVEVTRTP